MIITCNDISKRIRNVKDIKSSGNSISTRLYTESGLFCENNAVNAIKNWENLAETTNEAFNEALDIFIELCMNANESTIRTCGDILVENVTKVRNATQLCNSIKYKNSRLKSKIGTKINRKIDDVSSKISDALGNLQSSLQVKGAATTPSADTKGVAQECFNNIYEEAIKVKECDRIIENYSKISKRFNLDKLVDSIRYPNDIYSTIVEMTSYIDTYNISFKSKYNHALEMSYYVLNKHNMNYPSDKIIEAVTDYFIFSSVITENNIQDIKNIRDISVLYEKKDFDSIDYLFDDDEDDIFNGGDGEFDASDFIESYCSTDRGFIPLSEGSKNEIKKEIRAKKKELRKAKRTLIKDAKKGNPEERVDDDVQDQVNQFRKECAKDPDNKNNLTRLKSLITGIFTKTPYQIVYELPGIFSIIRGSFVIGATYINPVLGVITLITNSIIKMTLSRKQTEKIVKAYQSEIDSVKSKLESAKDDDTKDKLQKYLDELNKDYKKIKEYENNLYSDDENYDRDTSTEYGKDTSDDDWDFGLDDDWDDFDFEEAASIIYISDMMQSINEGLIDNNLDGVILGNIYKLDNDSIDALSDFSITVPVVLEKNKLCESLISYRNELRKTASKASDYIRIDCLNDNIIKLKENNMVYATSNNLSGIRCYLACLNEMVNMNSSEEYVMEMNFTNTLKLAVDRLKKTATKLKDKDKQISNTIDVSVNNISKAMEDAITNDNRDAIIKGRILPSASKCIKLALAGGALWQINPAVAIITSLGAFACSKKLKAKERQMVLDDIEIELKMCDRYIKQAEDDNDLKKVRQLEIIQRNLQRQQQRIKYNMHIVYKQNVPDVADND